MKPLLQFTRRLGLLLMVAHSQFRQLDPAAVARLTPARVAFDAVNGWERPAWQAAGFQFFRLGSPQ